ncbi:hypothetical protein VD0002_g2061 [Verticillium dahliae]|uniref:Uncharacterized protein n=1 Tax=Verticillium dahliae TaxID=27337 RepID=A0AA44WFC9_VERDA|nr:hypothetical protein BJF96_g8580 [Verticillium dahliae]PNH51832.1 hypothetical protein VD0003_g5455 [Verticillium dahliae]PNH67766.1 hypothetical protein VD0002_g2061 [Verticillium dahliae]
MGGVTRLCRSSATIVLAYWRSHGPLFLVVFLVPNFPPTSWLVHLTV